MADRKHSMQTKKALAALILLECMDTKKTVNRTKWMSEYLAKREEKGLYQNLVQEFAREEIGQYRRFTRMSEASFNKLLDMIRPYIEKRDTHMRPAITAQERLAVTLRFLATGETFHSLHCQFRISVSSISRFIPEVCEAIYSVLLEQHMALPTTEAEWKRIGRQFEERWNFPHCIGALDGKHVRIVPPAKAGSHFYNYKGFNSFVLMALVGADYKFIFVDVGTNGRISDGGVWNKTTLCKLVEERGNSLNIPAEEPLDGCEGNIPYLFVGDDAFALKSYLQKPYPGAAISKEKRLFNYRLSRARRISENAFGLLVKRWGIYKAAIDLDLEVAKTACLATCVLHNFIIDEGTADYLTSDAVDIENRDGPSDDQEGSWRLEPGGAAVEPLPRNSSNHSSRNARDVRDALCLYFNGPGAVPWQWERAKD